MFGLSQVELYRFETDSWTLGKSLFPGLIYPQLLPDPEGGVILIGGYTTYLGNTQTFFEILLIDNHFCKRTFHI